MRISDWSSDVCSSDLHGHVLPAPDLVELEVAALEAAVLLEVHRGAGAVVVDRPSRLQRRDAPGEGGDAVSRSVADPPDMLLDLVDVRASGALDRQQQQVDLVVPGAAVGILDLAVGFLRSEDHTSALPSLMRL